MLKRSIRLMLALAGSLGAFAANAQDMTTHEAALYAAAKPEGSLTWYVAQYLTSTAERIGTGFSERYPGLKVNTIRSTGQVAYSRLQQDIRAKVPQCDVFTATDFSHAVALKRQGLLMKYVPENAAKMEPSLRDIDPDGYYHATSANPTIMAYNTNLVSKENAPTNWTDLIDPKWKGKATLSHPGFSGQTGEWALMMEKLYGKGFFDKLAANDPQIGRSLGDPVTVLTPGERQIGISSYSSVLAAKAKGNPIEAVFPTDGSKVTRSPSFILANAPHPNAAKLFMEFLLSVPGSKLMTAGGYPSLRPEVPPPEGSVPIAQIKAGPVAEADVTGTTELIERWRAAFGN
jgi:iron(III) transport system substrate-binding protein